jgi:hypothetical protein
MDTRHTLARCDRCGVAGYTVDTTAGEIVEHGTVVAVAPSDRPYLMGSIDGQALLCDACAAQDA